MCQEQIDMWNEQRSGHLHDMDMSEVLRTFWCSRQDDG